MNASPKICRIGTVRVWVSDNDDVRIDWLLPCTGGVGTQSSKLSGLARPYNRLLEEGHQIGRMNHIFFEDPTGQSFLLGSICHTFTGRVLFFPGLNERVAVWIYSEKNGLLKLVKDQFIDHITLEKNHDLWHVRTFRQNGALDYRWPDYKTIPIPTYPNGFFWFSLSLQNPQVLETKPNRLLLEYSKVQKIKARLKALGVALPKEDTPLHNLTLNETSISEDEFLHLDFYFGPSNMPGNVFETHQPSHPPMVEGPVVPTPNLRFHPIAVPSLSKRLWIVTSKYSGKLREKAIVGGVPVVPTQLGRGKE